MLTKDLLQFTHRKGKLVPTFIDESKPALKKVAAELRDVFAQSTGLTASEIEAAADQIESREACVDGLRKLLLDRCEFSEPSDDIITQRWDLFRMAQELRDENAWEGSADFAALIARRRNDDVAKLRQQLFSDHPDERRCLKFDDMDATTLLSFYNRALFQTLFIFADDVRITVHQASLAEKRALFRQLKFHGLMSELAPDPEDNALVIYLSGPLKLFQKATTYGLRLAKFMPNVLHLKQWEIQATVQLKNKRLELKLDHGCGIKPRGRGLTGYVPTEFAEAMRVFNESQAEWVMEPSADFVHIGRQSYCFPDFDVVQGKRRVHVEMFHSWHRGQVAGRLKALETSKVKNLIIGVDKGLSKDKEIKALLENSSWFQSYGFEFNQFPTPRQLLKALDR